MIEVRTYMSRELNDEVVKRSKELGMSKSVYMRLLASLDIAVQRYQELTTYINLLHNRINEFHQELGIYATPLEDVPIINFN